MTRIYRQTADPKPTQTEMRLRKVARESAELAAGYRDLKSRHAARAEFWRRLNAKKHEQLRIEIKLGKSTRRAVRAVSPVADLFAR